MPFLSSLFSALDGTLLNMLTVLVGGILGTFIGNRLPERLHESLFGVLGLFTVLIGLMDALTTKNAIILLGSLLLGTLIGEAINIERGLQNLGDWIQWRLASKGSRVSEAFVTSSLVFCVGPLSILGPLDNGLNGDITKLTVKAILDGFAALAFSATLGWGVLLSLAVILIYQGGISLSASALAPLLHSNPNTITELTAAGGVILIAIGLKLLKIKDLRVANWLPALAVAPLLVEAVTTWGQFFH